MTPTSYCFCTKEKNNILSADNQINLILNSVSCSEEEKDNLLSRNFVLDCDGQSISHLNRYFGMLTGLYWVWKNSKEKCVGICTYRIFWKYDISQLHLAENTLILPKKIDVNTAVANPQKEHYNILDHYIHCHGDTMLKLLYGTLKTENNKLTSDMIDDLLNQHEIYPFNMFIASKQVFDKVCEILFEVIFSMHSSYNYFFLELEKQTGQIRFFDFLSERLLHAIFMNIDQLIPNINKIEMETIHFPHNYKMMTGAT
jgi:hypothetical protein